MKFSCLSERYFPGGKLNLFLLSVNIIAIFCTLSFVTIEASHASGLTATAKNSDGIRSQISEMAGSFIQNGNVGLSASAFLFRQKSSKAYRYHHERFKILKMVMGWVLAPVYYVFKYPKVSFFFFFLITVFLAVLDEFLYRYKRYPRLSEESTSGISAFYGASVSYALAANQCFFKTPEREEIIDEIHGNSEETECSPLAESLIERKPIIYNGKIALPYP